MAGFESIWFDHENQLSKAVAKEMGETLELRPMSGGGELRAVPDTTRAVSLVLGIFKAKGFSQRDRERALVTSFDAHASIDINEVGYELVQGDYIFRPMIGVLYRINNVEPTGFGRVRYYLTRVGKG